MTQNMSCVTKFILWVVLYCSIRTHHRWHGKLERDKILMLKISAYCVRRMDMDKLWGNWP